MRNVSLGCLSLSIWLTGCAGPMSPFGAIEGFGTRVTKVLGRLVGTGGQDARITFHPARQVLHASSPFSISIEDPRGIPAGAQFMIMYNGEDVTDAFMSRAERSYADPLHRELKFSSKHLRLGAEREHHIYVVYKRDDRAEAVLGQYMPPSCSAFETVRELASVPSFGAEPAVLDSINRFSTEKHFNPYYVAGLIAQESSFDPRALSPSKAMGLTQITALGEGEVIKKFGDWPRHPEVADMSLPELRLAILRGDINSENEWRLNPDLSIKGGVEYLSYLSDYWNRPDKRAQVERFVGTTDLALSEVMLASYNSGATRVSEAIGRRGAAWLNDDELREARRYVRRVNSYCDHFANKGE